MSVEECEDICVNYNGCEWYSWRHGGDPNNPVEAFCMLFEANGYTQADKNYITNKKGSCISALTEFPTQSTSNPFTTSTKPPTNPTEEPPTEEPPTEEPPTEKPPTEPTSQPLVKTLSRVLIITGKTHLLAENDFLISTEIIDLRDEKIQCSSWPNIHPPLGFANAGFLDGKYVICGGDKVAFTHSNLCYTMDNNAPTFTFFGSMSSSRTYGASMITPYSQKMWITGGHNENSDVHLMSSELISNDGSTEEGPTLPKAPRAGHTITSINKTLSLFIGGEHKTNGGPFGQLFIQTFYFNYETDHHWTEGPNLLQARMAHTAGLITDKVTRETFVIVVGGRNNSQITEDSELDTTEILMDGLWVPGENLYLFS